jgi:hypothetical protein
MNILQRLDQRLLPAAGDVLARLFRGAVRLRAFTTAVAVVAVTATLLVVHGAQEQQRSDPSLGDVLRVGVDEGGSIPGYVQRAADELAALQGEQSVYALVSFTAYLGPDRLPPVLAGVALSSVFARVPLPGTQTELVRLGAYEVPADVVAAMDATAARKAEEAVHYRRLLDKAANQPGDVRAVYLDGAIIADKEATAYRAHCSCVYAAVIYAAPAGLRAVAARPEIRAVDPITDLRRLDRTVFLPPLPEQAQVAGPPSTVAASPTPS